MQFSLFYSLVGCWMCVCALQSTLLLISTQELLQLILHTWKASGFLISRRLDYYFGLSKLDVVELVRYTLLFYFIINILILFLFYVLWYYLQLLHHLSTLHYQSSWINDFSSLANTQLSTLQLNIFSPTAPITLMNTITYSACLVV